MSTPSCCVPGALSVHTPLGSYSPISGVNCYSTGSGNKFVLWCTDVFGNEFVNLQQAADEIAGKGFRVIVPDFFNGGAVDARKGVVAAEFGAWMAKNPVDKSVEIGKTILNSLFKDLGATSVALIGVCYGSKVAFSILHSDSRASVSVHAHPSFLTVEDAEKTPANNKILFVCAENDGFFGEDLKRDFLAKLTERGVTNEAISYPGTEHGFSIRGSEREGHIEEMRLKAMKDMANFLANKA